MPRIEQQTCRACLMESKHYKSAFDRNSYDGREVTLSTMIKMCTNIEVNIFFIKYS